MIVLDTSALIKATTGEAPPYELLRELTSKEVHVPHLIDYEFRSALRGMLLGGKITGKRTEGANLLKTTMTFVRHPESVTGERAWELRDNFNPYDASYVALAEHLQCPLITNDAKMERQARTIDVHLH